MVLREQLDIERDRYKEMFGIIHSTEVKEPVEVKDGDRTGVRTWQNQRLKIARKNREEYDRRVEEEKKRQRASGE